MIDIHEIKPPINTPVLTSELFFWLGIFLLLIILLILIVVVYYLWKKYQDKPLDEKTKVKEETIVSQPDFLDQLTQICAYINEQELKIFYLRISQFLREYLTYKYKENFIDMTTREVLSNKQLEKNMKIKLQKFFAKVDMIKFANRQSNKEEAKKIYDLAVDIIQE